MLRKLNQFDRRKQRVRRTLAANSGGRPRLSVFRSSKHIYAQIIDDAQGPDASLPPRAWRRSLRSTLKTGADKAAATAVGKLLAERARRPGVDKVVFDRGGYRYHGRIKALADGAREGGLNL